MRSLLAITALPVLLGSCGKKNEAAGPAGAPNPMDRVQPVEVMPVTVMSLKETVGLVGSIAANESAELRPEIPGVINSIHFEEGGLVKKGALLAKLDVRELEAQLAEARASFILAEQNLERSQSLLADHNHIAEELARLRRAIATEGKKRALVAADRVIEELTRHHAREEKFLLSLAPREE